MASDDFIQISLENSSDNATKDLSPKLVENDTRANDLVNMDGERGLSDHVGVGNNDDMPVGELDICSAVQKPILQESDNMVDIDKVVENTSVVETLCKMDDGCSNVLSACSFENHQTDENLKRATMKPIDKQPSVHVVYSSLTRESQRKLKDLLQQWSEWQARHQQSSKDSSNETFECGEETYFPALHVGQENSSTVAFWVESQGRRKEDSGYTPIDGDSVPLYDRGFLLGSNMLDGSNDSERLERLEASRCFNCGSYSHSLKECTRPRDNAAISNARKQHSAKKNMAASGRGQTRYYQNSPGKFDDLKAGFLGHETRECLGIGEFDPPPWLHRMREIGYPPGYLDDVTEDQPSGITIFADEETKEVEEGELPEEGEAVHPEKKMTVDFPGINAPIPANADQRQWISSPSSTPDSRRSRSHHGSGRYEPSNGYHHDNRRSRDYREGASASENDRVYPRHGLRYSPYDRHPPPPVSPNLERSFSERGWRGILSHEASYNAYGHGSPQYSPSIHRPSPLQHGSTASFERWVPEGPYLPSPDASPYGRDRWDRDRDWSNHRHPPRW